MAKPPLQTVIFHSIGCTTSIDKGTLYKTVEIIKIVIAVTHSEDQSKQCSEDVMIMVRLVWVEEELATDSHPTHLLPASRSLSRTEGTLSMSESPLQITPSQSKMKTSI